MSIITRKNVLVNSIVLLFYDFHFRLYTVCRYYLCLSLDVFYSAYGKKALTRRKKRTIFPRKH